MNKVTKANRYSDAIFDIAIQDNSILTWVNFLEEISTLMSDLSVAKFFQDPKIRTEQKKDIISGSDIKHDQKQLNFFSILIDKNATFLVNPILAKFKEFEDKKNGVKRAKSITAYQLENNEITKINDKLGDMVGAKIESENIVDKSILGGFIAKFDDQMLDMSINGKLNKLKESILDY